MRRLSVRLAALFPSSAAALRVGALSYGQAADWALASARLSLDRETVPLWYRVRGAPVAQTSEAWVAAALLPAMRLGLPLTVAGPLSPRIAAALPRIQALWGSWDARYLPVPVRLSPHSPPAERGRGVACFFSGGVDSFYSALQHRDEITHLVFVRGWDILPDRADLAARVSESIRAAAAELGKPLIEIETNVRELGDPHIHWMYYHGSALASAALLLQSAFCRVYIPSTHSDAELIPWGSHPDLDPLWSTERLEIVHDETRTTRPEKVAALVSNETAQKYLRVCFKNTGEAYNCGRCEKCIRTMIALKVAGGLDRFRTFDGIIDPVTIENLALPNESTRNYVAESLRLVQAWGRDAELERALRRCLDKNPAHPPVISTEVERS